MQLREQSSKRFYAQYSSTRFLKTSCSSQMAWGSYWSWDIKEVWTLVTWLFYTLLLHSRLLRGWRGRRMGWLALIGLGLVLFTFVGVGWLARRVGLESLHVF